MRLRPRYVLPNLRKVTEALCKVKAEPYDEAILDLDSDEVERYVHFPPRGFREQRHDLNRPRWRALSSATTSASVNPVSTMSSTM